MVSLISIAMVLYLNGLSYFTLAVSVRAWLIETTRCFDLLNSIGLSVSPYPRGSVVNSSISS